MAIIFTDPEIAGLIQEPKPLPSDYQVKIQTRPKREYKEKELEPMGLEFKKN